MQHYTTKLEGPKAWQKGKVQPGVHETSHVSAVNHIETHKEGDTSYMGEYNKAWSGAAMTGKYVPVDTLRAHLCHDLDALLADPQTQLSLSFRLATLHGSTRQTQVVATVKLTFKSKGIDSKDASTLVRLGEMYGFSESMDINDSVGWLIQWDEVNGRPPFPATTTHLSFTQQTDDSPFRTPLVQIKWTCGSVEALLLCKKQHGDDGRTLTRNESVRLGIGMTSKEVELAHAMTILQLKPVVFLKPRRG